MELFDLVFFAFEMIGTLAFAVSGAMEAIERRLDIFGVVFLGGTTALGGGILRDVLIGHIPPRMFSSYEYVTVAVLGALLAFLVARLTREKYERNAALIENINNIFDAVGLGAFSVAGVRMAVAAGFGGNAFLAVFLGMITGIGGGLLRDVMIQKTPMVLRKRIYAIASIAGGGCYLLLFNTGVGSSFALLTGIAVTFLLRMFATIFKWNLPKAL